MGPGDRPQMLRTACVLGGALGWHLERTGLIREHISVPTARVLTPEALCALSWAATFNATCSAFLSFTAHSPSHLGYMGAHSLMDSDTQRVLRERHYLPGPEQGARSAGVQE